MSANRQMAESLQRVFTVGPGSEKSNVKRPDGWFAEARKAHQARTSRERWSRTHTKSVDTHGADGRAGV